MGELGDIFVATQGQNALFENLEPIAAARLAKQIEGLLDKHVQTRRKIAQDVGAVTSRDY